MKLDRGSRDLLELHKFGDEYQEDNCAVTQVHGVRAVIDMDFAMGFDHKVADSIEIVAIKEPIPGLRTSFLSDPTALLTKNDEGWLPGSRTNQVKFLKEHERYWYYMPREIIRLVFETSCFMEGV